MLSKIENIIRDIQLASVGKTDDKLAEIEQFRIKYIGKKGIISENDWRQFVRYIKAKEAKRQ